MNKYYTPSIEEFRVGFEYEYCPFPEVNTKFKKEVADWQSLDILYDDFEHEPTELFERTYRVKYLNKKDIESLGFKYDPNYTDLPELGFLEESLCISLGIQYLLYYNPEDKLLRIERVVNCGTGSEDYLFNGKIKNLSELKQVLTMIGVEYE
jgi:hypothetical protein